MLLPIYLDPQPILRVKTELVTPEMINDPDFQALLDDMPKTMLNADGVGLAAPQVGNKYRFTVIDAHTNGKEGKDFIFLINPKITKRSFGKVVMEEGCLSIPGIYGNVKRPKKITVEYLDRKGNTQTITADGFISRVIQHELDHLDGVLFTDKVINYTHEKSFVPKYPHIA